MTSTLMVFLFLQLVISPAKVEIALPSQDFKVLI